jgi:hypothetical protein
MYFRIFRRLGQTSEERRINTLECWSNGILEIQSNKVSFWQLLRVADFELRVSDSGL